MLSTMARHVSGSLYLTPAAAGTAVFLAEVLGQPDSKKPPG